MKKDTSPILVTKTFLPPLNEFIKQLEPIWESRWVTNGGPLVKELESKLAKQLDVKHVFFTSNGTIALQIALKAMNITGEVITTPFSYVATTNSILWENCKPVFVDIDPVTYCLDAKKIERAITKETQAIMAVHVYGQPCDVKTIEKIAKKHNLKVIYDAAHAFDVNVNNKSVFQFGDISTLSFHATKLFHSGEGGAIITNDDELAKQITLFRSFGHIGDDYYSVGVNGKNSEIHAAMGLSVLPHVPAIKAKRKKIFEMYDLLLKETGLITLKRYTHVTYNYSYYPVVFSSEKELLAVKNKLEERKIYSRRYFYPSLNQLPFLTGEYCPISESVAQRVLCLPLYHDLPLSKVKEICQVVRKVLDENNKLPTVTVGIPAHNEGKNIVNLINSILKQKQSLYKLEHIIVISDGSTDDTVEKISKLSKKHSLVKLYNDHKRKGKAGRLNELYRKNKSDYLLTLDADVLLETNNEINELLSVMKRHESNKVVAGNIISIKPKTLVGKLFYANSRIWYETRMALPSTDHIANLFGSATLLEKNFAYSVRFPKNITADEEYLYIVAKNQNAFDYAKNTKILSRLVESFEEARYFVYRMSNERYELSETINKDVATLHKIPFKAKLIGLGRSVFHDPFFVIGSIVFLKLLHYFPKMDKLNNVGMWEQVTTTKDAIIGGIF